MDSKVVRKRQRLFRYAVDSFIELLGQVTKRKVNYKCNNADTECWNNFMDTFTDSIGEEFIRKFLEYGVQSWFNDGAIKDYSRQVRFSWIFGKAAIERWNKNDIATNVFITRKGLKTKYKINLVKKKTELATIVTTVRSVEESFKAEYHNTKRGYLWCIANTALYFHKSSKCVTCVFKNECKELLKQEYPKIYVKRGYGEK